MMRKLLSLLLCLVLLTGCAAPAAPEVSESVPETSETVPATTEAVPEPVTFTDDLGRTVTVENPQRVAALLGSFAQVWYLAGGTVCASADDAWDDFDLPMAKDAVNLGMTKDLSLEKLLGAEPDFIIASANTSQHRQWQETLEATGTPTAYFDVADFEDYLRMLKICTDITGREDKYQEKGLAVQAQIDAVLARSAARLDGGEGRLISLRQQIDDQQSHGVSSLLSNRMGV